MTQYLGVDYGSRRIGLAIGDSASLIVTPMATLTVRGDIEAHVTAVVNCANAYAVKGLVVGLPLNMDDSEGPQAKLTRQFGDKLGEAMNLLVHYYDERLSSVAAEELLQPAEFTRKKKKARLDGVAAQVILQGFLDSLAKDPHKDENG